MGHAANGDRPAERICPIHGCSLERVQTCVLEAWYCRECDCCYTEHMTAGFQGRMTLSGKTVVCLPNSLPRRKLGKESQTPLNSNISGSKPDDMTEKLRMLPPSNLAQFCPVHGKQMETRLAVAADSAGWSREIDVGYCRKCRLFYTNHQEITMHPDAQVLEVPVVWNPKLFREYRGKKSRPFFEIPTIHLRDAPVRVERKCPSAGQDVVADAWNQITTPDGFPIRISGVYALRSRGFVCSLKSYLTAVTPEDDPYVQRVDPKSLVEKARKDLKNPYNKKALAVARRRREQYGAWKRRQSEREVQRERLEQSILPYQCYTLPLLKGSDCCPFCGGTLEEQILRVAVYHAQRADKTTFVKVGYCAQCEVPLINQKGETDLLRRVSPGMVYVFDAKSCHTPLELRNRAREKILVRKLPKALEPTALQETDNLNDAQGPDIPLNLSYEPNTKVWVYAERCHCAACQKKYGRNTIQNRTALVETITHKTIQMTVQFCTGCGKYYMNLSTFQQYCKKYGGILLECVMTPELCQQNASWLNFRPDTVLSRCGYSVREGIPQEYRQTVLAYILDSGRASKHEILELITRFIRIRHTRMPAACKRWEEDLLFVSRYQIQRQPQVKGLTFRRAGRTGPNDKSW